MKLKRSTKCSLKFTTDAKLAALRRVLAEYGRVANCFIEQFWELSKVPEKSELLKNIVNSVDTWFSHRLAKVAAREAIDMVKSAKTRGTNQPKHRGQRMCASCDIADLKLPKSATEFDGWLHLSCIGDKVILDIPVRFHKHYNELASKGTRFNAYIITDRYVQFVFEVETKPKRAKGKLIGLDTGVNTLAATSNGKLLGTDVREHVDRINRCKHGSHGQQRARRALKQRMDEVAKEVINTKPRLLVVEKLKNLNKKTKVKRRLTKNIRRVIGTWAYRYWLDRVEQNCEWNRVSFRTVNPAYTSIKCFKCGHTDKSNRCGSIFRCTKCGYRVQADIGAAKNILERFLTGPYGAGFKLKKVRV